MRRRFQCVFGQQGGVAVHTSVAVGKVLCCFQPPHLIQLSAGQRLQALVGQAAFFVKQFHVRSPFPRCFAG